MVRGIPSHGRLISVDKTELMPAPLISKTSFLAGCQCPKLLWTKLNDRDAFPGVDPATQAIFDQGHAIGELAKLRYPGGIEVGPNVIARQKVVDETREALTHHLPLYEPAFISGSGFARIDILVPDGSDAWRLIEVKSGTKVKEENILDTAFQLHVCQGAGLTITTCSLMHVNRDYIRRGAIDPSALLTEEDITGKVLALLPSIPSRLEELEKVAAQPSCPEVSIGPHCNKPYSCDLQPGCWAFLPSYPVTSLCQDRKGSRWNLLSEGIHSLPEIPHPDTLSPKQQIQVEATRSGTPHVSKDEIESFLHGLQWPLAFFDLETTSSAIPLYDGTRPYQQVPFQFSLHVQQKPGGDLVHHEFLASGREDPRPALLDALRSSLPGEGSVVAYNASFENSRLRECAAAFPGQAWVAGIPERTVDLLIPFRNFWFHHRDQHGSASLKGVLPALTGTDYSHLEIQDGNAAARAFTAAEFGNLPPGEHERLRNNLLQYCKLDTQAMVDLLGALEKITD